MVQRPELKIREIKKGERENLNKRKVKSNKKRLCIRDNRFTGNQSYDQDY